MITGAETFKESQVQHVTVCKFSFFRGCVTLWLTSERYPGTVSSQKILVLFPVNWSHISRRSCFPMISPWDSIHGQVSLDIAGFWLYPSYGLDLKSCLGNSTTTELWMPLGKHLKTPISVSIWLSSNSLEVIKDYQTRDCWYPLGATKTTRHTRSVQQLTHTLHHTSVNQEKHHSHPIDSYNNTSRSCHFLPIFLEIQAVGLCQQISDDNDGIPAKFEREMIGMANRSFAFHFNSCVCPWFRTMWSIQLSKIRMKISRNRRNWTSSSNRDWDENRFASIPPQKFRFFKYNGFPALIIFFDDPKTCSRSAENTDYLCVWSSGEANLRHLCWRHLWEKTPGRVR